MTARQKLTFIQYTFIQKLRELDPNTKALFGKMNLHQMIEHVSYAMQVAYGKIPVDAINKDEVAEKAYRWMMEDKPFKENTPNALLPDEPIATTTATIGDAIDNLEDDIQAFVDYYKAEPGRKVLNAFFGELDYYEQVQLLYKHTRHHLAQFGALSK
jgi:hypothetical protein